MAEIKSLRCTVSGENFAPGSLQYFNTKIGEVATLDILYDYDALAKSLDRAKVGALTDYSMWRYRDLLPIQPESPVPPLRVGFTPLYDAPRLAKKLNIKQVFVKDDGLNPTGSLKDRASAMVITHAMEAGINTVATASTGNAAAALAGVGAAAGIKTIIFVPATAPEAKIAQLLVYGAKVILVEGTYDQAFDLCMQLCEQEGWYNRNTGINPYTTEGKKTAAFEIAEQLNWNVPDVVVVSVGDGSIIGGLYKGFYDLAQIGWIKRIPRLIGVQATGSSPLVTAWRDDTSGEAMSPAEASSIADSIVAGLPRDRIKALRAVTETNGAFVAVDDDAILHAIPDFARRCGVFAEPAAATSWAGAQLARRDGFIHDDETVVIVSTGNGMKDIPAAQKAVRGGWRVKPEVSAVREILHKLV